MSVFANLPTKINCVLIQDIWSQHWLWLLWSHKEFGHLKYVCAWDTCIHAQCCFFSPLFRRKQITVLKSCVWLHSVPSVKNLPAHPVCRSIRGLGTAHLTDCFDRCQQIQLRCAEMTQMQGNAVSQHVLSKCPNMWIHAARTCGLFHYAFVFTTVTAVISVLIFRSNVLNPDTAIIGAIGFGLCKSQYMCWINLLGSIIPVFCAHIAYSFRQMFAVPPKKDFVMLPLTQGQRFHLYAVKQLTVCPFQPAVDVRITCHSAPGILRCWTGIPPTLLTVSL